MINKKLFEIQEGRLEVLEELIQNMYMSFGEMLGILETLKYLQYIQKDIEK